MVRGVKSVQIQRMCIGDKENGKVVNLTKVKFVNAPKLKKCLQLNLVAGTPVSRINRNPLNDWFCDRK